MKIDMKIAFAVLFAIMFLATPIVSVTKSAVVLTDPHDWYMYVPGVLDTDTYKLYPYKATSLNIGFSKFGEFINPYARTGANYAVGVEYADPTDPRDPFANEAIDMNQWLNGWLINVTYVSSILTPSLRNIWAFAEYADTTEPGVGKEWASVSHYTAGAGGRQTNGYAYTDPINVIQDGPRRFVAVLSTHLYDVASGFHFSLVDVDFTIVFDKAEKNVLVYKDVHYRLGPKEGMINVQFSNRGEWDLGPAPIYTSQAKYFHQELDTCYGGDYLLTPWILRDVYDVIPLMSTGTYSALSGYAGGPITQSLYGVEGHGDLGEDLIYYLGCPESGSPGEPAVVGTAIVTVNGALQIPDLDYTDAIPQVNRIEPDMNYQDMVAIKFLHDIVGPAVIRIEYKNVMKYLSIWNTEKEIWESTDESHHYDVAQFISADLPNPKYVGYAAFWPTCSDYMVDGWQKKFVNLWATPVVFSSEAVTTPSKKIPFLIGEWDFMLSPATSGPVPNQFRGVTNYGIVDWHDAYNNPATGTSNDVIDKEVLYQLNEVFNPWDINDAVHKQESRWVYVATGSATTATLSYAKSTACKSGLDDKIYYAVVSSEKTALSFAANDWTGYFLRDSESYPAESLFQNKFQDSSVYSTIYSSTYDEPSKNWWVKLNGATGYEMLKITPIVGTLGTPATPLTLQLKDLVDFGFWYRMDAGSYNPFIEIKVYSDAYGTGTAYSIQARTDGTAIGAGWHHYTLSEIETYITPGRTADEAFQRTDGVGGFHSFQHWTSLYPNYYVQYVAVQAQDGVVAYIDDLKVTYTVGTSGVRYERVYNMEEDKLVPSAWDAYCSFAERVEVGTDVYKRLGVGSSAPSAATFTAAGVTKGYTIVFWTAAAKSKLYFWQLLSDGTVDSVSVKPKILYSTIEENEKGRYEWNVVGTYSAPVDSAGSAMVSEYFDSKKDISVWMSGLDMYYLPKVPYIFSPSFEYGYYDDLGRVHVKDDWCTTVPIESSNIIVVGGPLANLGAYYLNDFTPAFWDYDNSQIIALSCWSMNAYRNGYDGAFVLDTGTGAWVPREETEVNSNIGYAVISTYKDKNQTVWLDVWGITGQDTYYATWAIWNTWLGMKLQQEPNCTTTLILRFDYSKHPTANCFITIVETLGTISEYNWGPQVDIFSGDSATVRFQLAWRGIDTSNVVVYYGDYASKTLIGIAYTIDEWGTLIFASAPLTGTPPANQITVVYYLKQPPIHPCRPVPQYD